MYEAEQRVGATFLVPALMSNNSALSPFRTAVKFVMAAHGLGHITAAVISTGHLAARRPIGTHISPIRTYHAIRLVCLGRSYEDQQGMMSLFSTRTRALVRIAGRSLTAAVHFIGAADCVNATTASVIPIRHFTTCFIVLATNLPLRADFNVYLVRMCHDQPYHGMDVVALGADSEGDIALVSFRTTMFLILTAYAIQHWAALIFTNNSRATARVSIRALFVTTRTDDVLREILQNHDVSHVTLYGI